MIRKWTLICGLALSTTSLAEIDIGSNIDSGIISDVNIVMIDRTITIGGREFARNFNNFMRMNYPQTEAVITIKEYVSAKTGSRILVQYGNDTLQELNINGRNSNNRRQAEAVAQVINQKITRRKLTEALTPDVDLASDEI